MQQQAKDDLLEAASLLYANLKADINNASTRIEHIRLTALAQEAENLYLQVLAFINGAPELPTDK